MVRRVAVAAALLPRCIAAAPALAALQVDVNQGNIQPLPIAIPDFVAASPGDAAAGQNIANVVRADLDVPDCSSRSIPNPSSSKITNINAVPNFANWRVITAQGLVTGQAATQPDGRLRVDFRLWDVFGESQMLGLQYFTQPDNWRRIAHMISDAIYQRITGEKGYFDTRIVFISESGPALARKKRLAVMDEDGANPIFLTSGDYLVLTPRFNPDGADDRLHVLYRRQAARVSVRSGKRPAGDAGRFPEHDVFARAFRPTATRSR